MNPETGKRSRTARSTLVVAALWLLCVAGGAIWLGRYGSTAGEHGRTPERWPAESRVARVAGRATIVFFAHPQCPCSRASLGELNRILARCQVPVSTVVVFQGYRQFPETWTRAALWRQAEAIPGVQVMADTGEEARRFASRTSGHVVLYDEHGRLQFSGGITAARGQAGDNDGEDALRARLAGRAAAREQAPVFGCSLTDSEASPMPRP